MRGKPSGATIRHLFGHLCGLAILAAAGACAVESEPTAAPRLSANAAGLSPVPGTEAVGDSGAGNYLAGRYAERRRDFGAAAELLGRALVRDPDDIQLLRHVFLAKLSDGEVAEAIDIARTLVATDGAAPVARLMLAVEAVRTGDLGLAESELEALPDHGISGVMKPMIMAWVYAGQGRETGALDALEAMKQQPGLRVLYELHAALINDLLDNPAAAAEHYRQARDNSRRTTLRVVQGLGRHYERSGEAERAKTLYESYLGENPDSVILEPALARIGAGESPPLLVANAREGVAEVLFNIASTMSRENSGQVALVYGRIAIYLRPGFDLAQMLVGGILETMDRHVDAIAVYRSVPTASPLNWSARLRVAGNLEALERSEEAIALLRELTRDEPTKPDAMISLGDIYRSNKKYRESVDAYDRAFEIIGDIEERHWTLLYSRGISLERFGEWARAERDFEKALALNPDQPYVLNYLGYSWVDQGMHLDRAREMIERAVELRPNDGYIVDSLGWALYRLNDFAGAVGHLERAAALRPQDPTINDHLGDAYWRVGRRLEARFQWQRALALEPEPGQVPNIEDKIRNGLRSIEKTEQDS